MSVITFEPVRKVPLDQLTADLDYDLPDLPRGAATQFLRRAAIKMARDADLCRRTAVIRPQPGVVNYRLDPADRDVAVNSILDIRRLDGQPVKRLLREPARPGVWGPVSWMNPGDEICFHGAVGPSEIIFSVVPTMEACAVDAVLAEEFYETLLLGARSMAYDLTAKSWSDPNRALNYQTRFLAGMRQAKVDQLMHRQRGAVRADFGRVL